MQEYSFTSLRFKYYTAILGMSVTLYTFYNTGQLFPNGWLSLKASNISRTEAGIHPYYSINTKTHNTPVVYFRETFDSLLLKRVSSMFQATFPDISDNSFTSLFIATWHEPGALATV